MKPYLKHLLPILTVENNEEFVPIDNDIMHGAWEKMADMKEITGNQIYVRKSILHLLKKAQKDLNKQYETYKLYVTYGFRSLEIQEKYFHTRYKELQNIYPNLAEEELREKTHNYVADPRVAGHPTGGAFDILLYDIQKESFLDFGSEIFDFTNDICITKNSSISKLAQNNRNILLEVLKKQGFSNYPGERRHFSYGDRERAYRNKTSAMYEQKKVEEVLK